MLKEIKHDMATWQDVKDVWAMQDAATDRVLAKLKEVEDKLDAMPAGPTPEEFGAFVDSIKADTQTMADALGEVPAMPEAPVEDAPAPVDAPVE